MYSSPTIVVPFSLPSLPRRPVSWRRDTVAALLWMAAVVPAAMGFWLVAGSLPPTVQLVVNPMLWGVLIAMLLERITLRMPRQ
jgi:hypothetical protein